MTHGHDDGERLSGGNAAGEVVRIGDTVRKPWTDASASVAALTGALRDARLDVPAHLGRDDDGRQVIEYVPGEIAMSRPPLDRGDLARIGRMVRAIHDLSPRPAELRDARWDVLLPVPGADLICHNDLAPWNLVVGERWVFIDWDGAGPSTRLWDLAYAAHTFAISDARLTPSDAGARLRVLVDGYDASAYLRARLPDTIAERAEAMHRHLLSARDVGWEPWATMADAGHAEHWSTVAGYLRVHRDRWAEALLG